MSVSRGHRLGLSGLRGHPLIGDLVHLDPLAAVRDNLLVVVLLVMLVVRLLPGVRVGRTGDVLAAKLVSIPPPVWVGLLVVWTTSETCLG